MNLVPLKVLGRVIEKQGLCQAQDISRATIKAFSTIEQSLSPRTISSYLSYLADFFDWLGLNTCEGIHEAQYLDFSRMQPLPEPPPPRTSNQMVRIINMLIEHENIRPLAKVFCDIIFGLSF